jgi:acyl-CoA synthetase (AMP-forming)/AMP-acid ligase II
MDDHHVTDAVTYPPLGADKARTEDYRREGWWTGEKLADRFEKLVYANPSHRALVDDRGTVLTRAELWNRAGALARSLDGAGVRRGDAVLVYLPNTAQWQVTFLACLRLGAVPATLPITTDADTLAYVYDLVGARAVIAPRTARRRPTGEWARAAAAATGRAATVLTVDDDGGEVWTRLAGPEAAPVVPDGVDHLMFTSSTPGMPKAVMHTADTLAAANRAFAERFGVTEHTPIFMPSPLGHSVGAWHGGRFSLYLGATLVLQDVWDPVRGLEIVDAHQCAFTAAATPFLKDLVDAEWPADRPRMASLKTFLCGGAPVPPSLLEQATELAPHTFVTVLWGMTEGTGTTCTPDSTRDQLTNTAGCPVDGLDLAILEAGDDGVGELAIRGPGVFVGYLGQEEMYRGLLTEDGFFRTGDLARLDDDGYLRLTGRLKDIIIRGGVNISPMPIEDAIAAHPAVRRVAVIGQVDDRLGERICAVIVAQGTAPTLDELNAWLVEHGLSTRKLPESLVVVDDVPVTAAGKIRKVDLRRKLEEQA